MGATPRRLRAMHAIAAVLAGLLPSAFSDGRAVAAQPPYTLEERAVAIARPALILLENESSGYLRNKTTGELIAPDRVVFSQRCSGFVVSTDGHVLTTTNCVQPTDASLLASAAFILASYRISLGQLATDQRDAFIADTVANAVYTGQTQGEKPAAKLVAQQNSVQMGQATIAATVVAATPSDGTNIALVKLVLGGLPVAELNRAELGIGTPLNLIGYRGVDLDKGQVMFVPVISVTKVSKVPSNEPRPVEVDAELGIYSHGGMAVDASGKVVGLINIDQFAKDNPRRAVITSEKLSELLNGNGVRNSLSRTDQTYREALDAYFGGKYSEAITKFDQVIAAVPDHELATAYRKQAVNRRAVEGDPSAELTLQTAILVGVGAAAVLVIVFLVIFMLVRRRAKRKREATQQYIDMYSPLSPTSGPSGYPTSGPAGYPTSGPAGYSFPGYMPVSGAPTGYGQTVPAPISIPPAQMADPQANPNYPMGTDDDQPPNNPWAPTSDPGR